MQSMAVWGWPRWCSALGASLSLASACAQAQLRPPLVDGGSAPAAAAQAGAPAPVAGCKVLDPELQGTYQGGCVQGLAEGQGEALGSAAHYSGGFVAGKKHGTGSKRWLQTGDVYTGAFANDYRHGRGSYLWGAQSAAAGHRYVGDFVQDKRHGYGTFTWPSGDSYSGSWVADAQTGPATAMQQRQQRHLAQAKLSWAAPGQVVCQYARSFGGDLRLMARVLSVQETTFSAQVLPAKDHAQPQAAPVLTGQSFTQWLPCQHAD